MAEKKPASKKHPGAEVKLKWHEKMYNYDTIKQLHGSFINEKELKKFVIKNIKAIAKHLFNDEYIEHKEEYHLLQNSKAMREMGLRKGRSLDIYLKCKNYNYIIELKNPRYRNKVIDGIGQILNYSRYFNHDDKLVLMTGNMDMETLFTIEEYNLPIEYYYIDKYKYAQPARQFKIDPEKEEVV